MKSGGVLWKAQKVRVEKGHVLLLLLLKVLAVLLGMLFQKKKKLRL